jgi:RHS repeat-associated protein
MRSPRLHLTLLLITTSFATPSALGQTDTKTLGSFTYDGSGNVTSMGPDTEGLTNEYEYDSAGRLIRFVRKNASTGGTVLNESYEYDAYGNQTKQTTNSVDTSLNADPASNRLSGATYDQAGNMIEYGAESYTFDPVGTMTTKSGWWGTATYIYTADDERIAIAGPDGTWRYTARELDGKVLREWSAQTWNGSWTWAEDYVYRDGQLAAAVRADTQGGTRHFHLDHLGSPRLISNDVKSVYAEHSYYPFGREITSPTQELSLGHDTPEPMKFTGHERDFAGSYSGPVLDYMHARYYNPGIARFASVDPIGVNPHRPLTWNRYSYGLNNPASYTDPTGLYPCKVRGSDGEEHDGECIDVVSPATPVIGHQLGLLTDGMTEIDRDLITRAQHGDEFAQMIVYGTPQGVNEDFAFEFMAIAPFIGWIRGAALAGEAASSEWWAPAAGETRVTRWMSEAEFAAMKQSGGLQVGGGGRTYVTSVGAAKPGGVGGVRVDFNVPTKALERAGHANWYSIGSYNRVPVTGIVKQ